MEITWTMILIQSGLLGLILGIIILIILIRIIK